MKGAFSLFLLLAIALFGCSSKAKTGALAGGVIGAGTGGIVGGGKGALIGGSIGAMSGGIVGGFLDEQDRKVLKRSSPKTIERMDREEYLTLNDVIKLSQAGVSDDLIIKYMKERKTIYNLTQDQIDTLKKGGVSQRVMQHMVNTGR